MKLAPIGAEKLTPDGYVRRKITAGRWQLVQRIVMEEQLGRALRKREVVHHRNGVRHDNRPENLELLSDQAHGTLHHPKGVPVPADLLAKRRLKPGQWSRKHACCVRCGTTERKHNGRGLCVRCADYVWKREKWDNDPEWCRTQLARMRERRQRKRVTVKE